MMYWIKETPVNRPLVMWWQGLERGKKLYSVDIRSQSFSESMRLDCELRKSFSVFPPPLDGTQELEPGWRRAFAIHRSVRLSVNSFLQRAGLKKRML